MADYIPIDGATVNPPPQSQLLGFDDTRPALVLTMRGGAPANGSEVYFIAHIFYPDDDGHLDSNEIHQDILDNEEMPTPSDNSRQLFVRYSDLGSAPSSSATAKGYKEALIKGGSLVHLYVNPPENQWPPVFYFVLAFEEQGILGNKDVSPRFISVNHWEDVSYTKLAMTFAMRASAQREAAMERLLQLQAEEEIIEEIVEEIIEEVIEIESIAEEDDQPGEDEG